MACTTTPTVTIGEGQMAVRINFPLTLNSASPLGNAVTNEPYNIQDVMEMQISSWLPNYLRDNYFELNCNVVVTTVKDAYYLVNTYPDLFTYYTNP